MTTDNSIGYSKTDGVAPVRVYRRRWIYLGLFFTLNCMMSVCWVEVVTVTDSIKALYSASFFKTAQLTNIFYIIYVPGSVLSTYLLGTYGLRVCSSFGGVLVALASWLRVAASREDLYWLQALATGISAVGQPCILNGCSQFSSQWFPMSERNLATMIGETIPAAFGGMILSIIVDIIRTPTDPGGDAVSLVGVAFEQLRAYFIYVAIVATAVTVVYAVLMREKPPTPPGLATHESHKTTLVETFAMFKNKDYVLLLMMMNADFGMVAVLTGLLSDVTDSYNYSQSQTDLLFGCVLGGAIAGGVVVAPLADYLVKKTTDYYKRILVTVNLGALFSLLGFILVTKPDNLYPMLILLTATSFFWTGAVPVIIEMGSEIVYPLPEGAATSYLLMVANLFAFALIMLFYAINEVIDARDSMWLILGMQAFTCVCTFLYNGRYKKREAERIISRKITTGSIGERALMRVSESKFHDLQEGLLDSDSLRTDL